MGQGWAVHGERGFVTFLLTTVLALMLWPSPDVHAAWGDEFGVAAVNAPGAPTVPAFPGQNAFWAGTCSTASAPIGPVVGGVGERLDTMWIPKTIIDGIIADDADPDGQQIAGPAPSVPDQCVDWGGPEPFGNPADPGLWNDGREPAWRLAPVAQAAAHPDGSATMWLHRTGDGFSDGDPDNVWGRIPAGFTGDLTAVPKCTADQFAVKPIQCPPESQVGTLHIFMGIPAASGATYSGSTDEIVPVYNLEPRHGRVAELGVSNLSTEDAVTARLVIKARTHDDFGADVVVSQIPAVVPLLATSLTLWGIPWDSAHDEWRPPIEWRPDPLFGEIPPMGLPPADRVGYDPSWGPIKPFLSNPSECSGKELTTRLAIDSYQDPGPFTDEGDPDLTAPTNWKVYDSPSPPVTGCADVPFDASFDPQPSSRATDSPSGLSVELTVPQNDVPRDGAGDPLPVPGPGATEEEIDQYVADAVAYWRSNAGLATSQMKKAVVTLPEGVSVNPSGAAGLEACSDAQIGIVQQGNPPIFNNDDPFDGKGLNCPKGSRIGTVEVDTAVLDEPLTGDVVLGDPKSTDPESGQMFRLFIVARSKERGLVAKILGTSRADAETGRLTTIFDQNPRVPFERIRLQLKGGSRGLLAMPPKCGNVGWTSLFSPWSTANGTDAPVSDAGHFVVDQRCGEPFAPTLDAGMSPRQGGGSGTFTLSFARQDGEQFFRGLSSQVPQGLLANVGSVTLCTNAQADANGCPLASKIGTVDGAAGSGTPFVLEKKGSIYLTEGYKGAPYGLAVSVPVEAGPFTGAFALKPIVVRQALRVDPTTAQATVESDPFPTIWHGIPLRIRSVVAKIDRPGFMRNPTDCSPKQVRATFSSTGGKTASAAEHFQVAGCGNLSFKPKLSLAFTGKKRQARYLGHPGIEATLTQPPGQAGIKVTVVRLPKAIVLDPDRVADASKQCEYEPSLAGNCPASSIIGRARAVSPLLERPLEGPVYFAKNRRIDKFGRSVPTLPSLVVALRGEIAINVRANSDAIPGKALISTFPSLPDAPVSRFELKLEGGKTGILVVSRDAKTGRKLNLCGKQVAEVDMDAHNGKIHDFDVRMKTPCKKAKKKARKRSKKRR